jgi:hypothetical protein
MLIIFLCSGLNSFSQYITFRGNQFIDENGVSFYPMTMNYIINFTRPQNEDPSTNNSYIYRASEYGFQGWFDYSQTLPINGGASKILQDFYEIKNLGFNTVRLIMKPIKNDNGVGMRLRVKNWPYGQDLKYINIDPIPLTHLYIPITTPQRNPLQFYFENLVNVINIANSIGLKVICPTIEDSREMISGTASSINQIDNRAYLSALATYINAQQIHNILAYEFIGEPTYQVNTEKYFGTEVYKYPETMHTKTEICEIVNSWVDAIKTFDPNHLTTIGSVYLDDPFFYGWDPFLLNVDFVNVHFYPDIQLFEFISNPYNFRSKYINRYNNLLYVFDKYMKKPYIIGETCFNGENQNGNPGIVYPIGIYGSESDQNNFVLETFPKILGSNAAGYGWWQFQNVNYIGDPVPPYYYTLADYVGDHEGLLKKSTNIYPEPNNLYFGYQALRKTAANTFINYKDNLPNASVDFGPMTVTFNKDDEYYNPYLIAQPTDANSQYAPGRFRKIKGYVNDQNGNHIEGAIVKACCLTGNKYKITSRGASGVPLDSIPEAELFSNYTLTDVNGYFEIYAFDNKPGSGFYNVGHVDPNLDGTFDDIKISAYGSVPIERGWEGGPIQFNTTYVLKSLQNEFERTYSNINVAAGSTKNLHAFSILNVSGMTIRGTSEITARNMIVLKPTFSAFAGSNTRIYNNYDCNDMYSLENNYPQLKNIAITDTVIENKIEDDAYINIYPNPFTFSATIEYKTSKEGLVIISIYNMEGVKKATLLNENKEIGLYALQLNKYELAPGLYIISINSPDGFNTKKVMLLE